MMLRPESPTAVVSFAAALSRRQQARAAGLHPDHWYAVEDAARPRRGACREYWRSISDAASSSMILGFQGLPQNPLNQRPTMALLLVSRDMSSTLLCWDACRRAHHYLGVTAAYIRILRFASSGLTD